MADEDVDSVVLKYRDPDGEENTFSETPIVVDVDEGEYYIDVDLNTLTPDGVWTFWSYVVTIEDKEYSGNPWQEYVAPQGQYPVNKDYIKNFLGITVTTQDARIDSMIPVLISQYLSIRNAPFDKQVDDDENEHTVYPMGMPAVIAQMMDYQLNYLSHYQSATSERIGSYSVTYGGGPGTAGYYGYPSSITSQIKKYVRGC
jgi:hypothetical protein